MINIDSILKSMEINASYKNHGILLASLMFIWSGINKIFNFNKKVKTLSKKTKLNNTVSSIGMVLVILLELVGFVFLIEYFYQKQTVYNMFSQINRLVVLSQKQLIQIILLLTLAFLVVVTLIYHPFDHKKPIPFLSNLTTFGLFLYVYADLFG